MPLPQSAATGRARKRGFIATSDTAPPVYWMGTDWDSRVDLSATNTTGVDLHDHLLTATLPATVDATSLRIVETTTDGAIDDPSSWRYNIGGPVLNRTRFLVHNLTGTTLTFKVPGKWASGDDRTFHAYWHSQGGGSALSVTHLGGNPQGWTVALTAGTTGDHYIIVAGGQTYDHTMTVGQTAAQIGTALAVLINAGTVATATGTSTLTIKQTDYTSASFTVTVATSTDPAKLVVTKPNFYGKSRVGPDTDTYSATYAAAGSPFKNPGTGAATRPAWGHATSRCLRLGAWSVTGVGSKNIDDATVTSVVNNGPTITQVGAATGTGTNWTVAYTETYSHRLYTGRKSDDTGAGTLTKYVDVWRIQIVYTCAVAYTPSTILNTVTANSGHDFLTLAVTDTTFGGNVTEATGNKYLGGDSSSSWYADKTTGVITAYDASADLSALTPESYIYGFHGNVHSSVFALVSAPVLSGWGTQAQQVRVACNGNPFLFLQVRNLSNASQIPLNATATIDAYFLQGVTLNGTSTGDSLLPDEAVELVRGILATQPTVTVGSVTRYSSGSVVETAKAASTKLVAGCQWFADNALSYTGLATNTGYARDLRNNRTFGVPDDDDGSYGEAFKLAGLCLRYLRLHEASVLTQIERQVQYFIDIELAARTAYNGAGTYWNGAIPYWYWAATADSNHSGGYPTEGGISSAASVATDPNMPGGVKAAIVYTQGQVRRYTSIDQMHMATLGLYHYRYLLRNEPAVTANTTLWTNALSLLSRMKTFETAHWNSGDRVLDNMYAICAGTTPANNNGVTTTYFNTSTGATYSSSPYTGELWTGWQVDNTTQASPDASSNSAIDYLFRGIYAPDTTLAGVRKFAQGRVQDMSALDLGHHDVTTTGTGWGYASTVVKPRGSHPRGWGMRSAGNNSNLKYSAGNTGDKHYVEIVASNRDAFSGRTGQRLAVVALAALFDDTYTVKIENDGSGNTVRYIPIKTYIDQLAMACSTHLVEETSGAARFAASGYLGGSTNGGQDGYGSQSPSKSVHAPYTGYNLFGLELALLVKSGANYLDYYSPNGVF